jgi:hypothetical protein
MLIIIEFIFCIVYICGQWMLIISQLFLNQLVSSMNKRDVICRNLSLKLATKASGLQGCEPRGSPGVTPHVPGSAREWRGVNSHTPKGVQLWELESQWTPKFSKDNFKGQNSMDGRVIYTIGKLLERKCLKWAHIAHLDIWNISYGQKKGQELNCQFDSQPLKVGNWPDLFVHRGRVKYRWKALDENYNFALDRISIGGFLAKLWGSKVARVPTWAILGLTLGSPGIKSPFGCRSHGQMQNKI